MKNEIESIKEFIVKKFESQQDIAALKRMLKAKESEPRTWDQNIQGSIIDAIEISVAGNFASRKTWSMSYKDVVEGQSDEPMERTFVEFFADSLMTVASDTVQEMIFVLASEEIGNALIAADDFTLNVYAQLQEVLHVRIEIHSQQRVLKISK